MIYIGWDGRIYRTGLASSDDLLHWNREGIILDVGQGATSILTPPLRRGCCGAMTFKGWAD
ncbi:MAG: hypothetical protein J7J76_07465 [Candidatus Latescibacteria bacterium]|nr:hypothetical protein [Candidatus Latescibacterota bacterium]